MYYAVFLINRKIIISFKKKRRENKKEGQRKTKREEKIKTKANVSFGTNYLLFLSIWFLNPLSPVFKTLMEEEL